MRFATFFAVALSAVAVSAHYNETHETHPNGTHPHHEDFTTTEIVTQYTTYCPLPTTIVENNHTYVVTEATTLTITDCPCTLTKTYTYVTETICPGGCEYPTDHPSYTNTVTASETPASPNYTGPSIPPPSEGSAVSNKATAFGGALVGLVAAAAFLL